VVICYLGCIFRDYDLMVLVWAQWLFILIPVSKPVWDFCSSQLPHTHSLASVASAANAFSSVLI